jgi:hypothetical protein
MNQYNKYKTVLLIPVFFTTIHFSFSQVPEMMDGEYLEKYDQNVLWLGETNFEYCLEPAFFNDSYSHLQIGDGYRSYVLLQKLQTDGFQEELVYPVLYQVIRYLRSRMDCDEFEYIRNIETAGERKFNIYETLFEEIKTFKIKQLWIIRRDDNNNILFENRIVSITPLHWIDDGKEHRYLGIDDPRERKELCEFKFTDKISTSYVPNLNNPSISFSLLFKETINFEKFTLSGNYESAVAALLYQMMIKDRLLLLSPGSNFTDHLQDENMVTSKFEESKLFLLRNDTTLTIPTLYFSPEESKMSANNANKNTATDLVISEAFSKSLTVYNCLFYDKKKEELQFCFYAMSPRIEEILDGVTASRPLCKILIPKE